MGYRRVSLSVNSNLVAQSLEVGVNHKFLSMFLILRPEIHLWKVLKCKSSFAQVFRYSSLNGQCYEYCAWGSLQAHRKGPKPADAKVYCLYFYDKVNKTKLIYSVQRIGSGYKIGKPLPPSRPDSLVCIQFFFVGWLFLTRFFKQIQHFLSFPLYFVVQLLL